ncbi:hydrogenase 2 operon protein HybA [Geotalea uraniireducens]|uniref:4Fe-4S ferredoxin, iron-sulfur binding domain protein n=1 Tax=Geotalea uraniireducens (strain Rf4) TaxID=351605 RepID=A5GFC9_GEOUR|nr:hydrogenase 2 operon protein HybA [Geotalea uraniireducens]ABQ26134.1 4Fe-4S ferredoxin, iron-sulfur binding domain protein [Geotalea uraniireducens Rf4]
MKNKSRREFLKLVGVTGAGLLTGAATASGSEGLHVNNEEIGMLYDATKCVGCKACMAACKRVNGDYGSLSYEKAKFDPDGLWDAPTDLSGSTRTLIKLFKESESRWSYVKYSCMHCQKPSCVSVCPVSAMTKDKVSGVVDYNKNTCIGCRYCQVACAFNIPKFQWEKSIPQIVKCDLCKNTNLREKGISACAEVCPVGAIKFGKRKDLLQEAKTRLRENPDKYIAHVYGEHEAGGTNHLYLASMPFNKLGLPDIKPQAPAEFSEKIQHTIYKGFIAPVALYSTLCFIAVKNMKKHDKTDDHDKRKHDGEER